MLTIKIPLTSLGVIFIVFGVGISVTATSTNGEELAQNTEEAEQTLQLISAEAYRKILIMSSRNRLERALIRLAIIVSAANPIITRPKLELPLATPINLYECSSRLGNIIGELRRLEERGYVVEVYGNPSSIYTERPNGGGCKDISGVSKFIALHH